MHSRNICLKPLSRYISRAYTTKYRKFYENSVILGIETSCDDTGCAVIDGSGKILGESLHSQIVIHTRYGGVNPLLAHEQHRNNIEIAVAEALSKANKTFNDLTAIAVTTKPGLLGSLLIGVKYARYLSRIYNKPIIPIHHMQAHALVARMYYNINFPFLVLLISGGHCQLGLVKDIEEFYLLGETLDNSPGQIFDKVARRMKLKNIPEYSQICGGRAVELAAMKATNTTNFEFPTPLLKNRDCNFSFSGLKDSLLRKLTDKEMEHQVMGCELIPEVYDLCASFQLAVTEHLAHRVSRAIMFCNDNKLIYGENKCLVISGGVASNNFIFKCIQSVANEFGYKTFRPPPQVCTDNGVMIAWNALEKLRHEHGMLDNNLEIDPTASLGKNLIDDVLNANIKTKVRRLKNISITYEIVLLDPNFNRLLKIPEHIFKSSFIIISLLRSTTGRRPPP